MKAIVELDKTISNFIQNKKKGGFKIRKLKDLLNTKSDIKVFKKNLIDNREYIMYDVLNSVEDYKNILKIHNFRTLPSIQKCWGDGFKKIYFTKEEIKEKYPKQYEMFEEAKRNP